MMHTLRRWIPVAAAAGLLAACGSSTTTSSNSSSAASSTPAGSPAPSYKSVPSDLGTLVIDTSKLPSGDTWTQSKDGDLGGAAGTHQRAWGNADNTKGVEIDILGESSVSAAAGDWDKWKTTIGGKVTASGAATACPAGAPSACAEVVGTWGADSTKGAVVLMWQQGPVLASVVLLDAGGTTNAATDKTTAEAIASSESDQIQSTLS